MRELKGARMISRQPSFFPGLFPGAGLVWQSNQFMQYPHIFPAPSTDTREQPLFIREGTTPPLLVKVFYPAGVSGSGQKSGILGHMRNFTQDPEKL
jgi:hypothetical protein